MTREEQVAFCKQCTNRKFDQQQGVICGLTNEKATFQDTCPDYNHDETYKPPQVQSTDEEEGIPLENISEDNFQRLLMDQNLVAAITSGLVIGIVGAILWGTITVATQFQIGYMAVAIGAGVGFGIRHFGRGVEQIYGIVGGAIALFSCLLGNFLSICGFVAEAEGMSILEVLQYFDYSYLPEVMIETFSPMDLLFYGIAVYEGYKFSFRVVTPEDLA